MCIAEPYVLGETEYAYQEIISDLNENPYKWTYFDLAKHYYLGSGRGLTLSEVGHLRGIINYFFYKLGKYNDVNAQIINAARKHKSGDFAYSFNNGYGFGDYLYVFGGGVVSGVFVGTVKHENGMMQIDGEMQYFYDDVFTDPLSIREYFAGTSDPEDIGWIGQAAEFGGTYYPIKDYWKTHFHAKARIFAGSSIYQWPQ
jgi:hypothetical protein